MNPTIPSMLMILLGVIWFGMWAKSIFKGLQSRHWTDGVGKVVGIADHSFSYQRPSKYHGTVTVPYNRKSYQVHYEVAGKQYETSNYRFGALIDIQNHRMKEGLRVPIKINPRDHSEAVVKPGVPLTALLGLVPVVIGLVWMWT